MSLMFNENVVKRFKNWKKKQNHSFTKPLEFECLSVIDWAITNNCVPYAYKKMKLFIQFDVPFPWIDRIERIKTLKYSMCKEKYLLQYGQIEGLLRWETYRAKQAETNTFSYKQEKYGMSKLEFDQYNKSRAVTETNLIKKHGKSTGKNMWKKYVARQSYTKSKQYFIDRFGTIEGEVLWRNVNKQKVLNLRNFIRKWGNDEGQKRFFNYIDNLGKFPTFYSKISQELFEQIDEKVTFDHLYYATKNKEFSKYDNINEKIYFYDFVIIEDGLKLCIEFHGDDFHANPNKYKPNDRIPVGGRITATECWEKDRKKQLCIESFGFQYLVVWESDYRRDKVGTINKILEHINGNVANNR
jgi:hypothetical protein